MNLEPATRNARAAHLSPDALKVRIELWQAGLTDAEIAARVGAKANTITAWRRKRGLATKQPPRSFARLDADSDTRRKFLYRLGWSDDRMAAHEGVGPPRIKRWRDRRGLPPNGLHARVWEFDELIARIRRAIGFGIYRHIADDVLTEMFLAIMEGRLELAQIERAAWGYKSSFMNRFVEGPKTVPLAIGPVEADQIHVALIRDDSHEDWLEQMGATVCR